MKTLLGQRIREQRRKKGWTMDKLAEKADLSVNYFWWTDDRCKPVLQYGAQIGWLGWSLGLCGF